MSWEKDLLAMLESKCYGPVTITSNHDGKLFQTDVVSILDAVDELMDGEDGIAFPCEIIGESGTVYTLNPKG
jgi:hypothetical protein